MTNSDLKRSSLDFRDFLVFLKNQQNQITAYVDMLSTCVVLYDY